MIKVSVEMIKDWFWSIFACFLILFGVAFVVFTIGTTILLILNLEGILKPYSYLNAMLLGCSACIILLWVTRKMNFEAREEL